MDCVGLIMWCKYQMVPYKQKINGPLLIIWDNCSPHKAKVVVDYFRSNGIELRLLPKNMNDLLQVVDLIINSALKSDQRQRRARWIYNQFQDYQIAVSEFREYLSECKQKKINNEEVTEFCELMPWRPKELPLFH